MPGSVVEILLVEDDEDDAFLIENTLERTSMPATRAHLHRVGTFKESLDWLSRKTPNVVLLDLTLPDSRGIQTLERLVAEFPFIPVVVLTGLDNDETALNALRSGAQDYLVKGQFDEKILWRVLRYAIERKQAQMELARLASFPENNPLPVIEINSKNEVTYSNPAALRTFPNLKEQGLNHPLFQSLETVCAELHGKSLDFLTRDMSLNSVNYEIHYSCVNKQHLLRLYVLDVSQRKRLEFLKDNFVRTVSHELRTPIAILKGSMENLLVGVAGPLTEKQQRIVQTVNQNVGRLERLVSDVLDISRLESGKTKLDLRYLNVKKMMQDCIDSFHVLANEKQIQLTVAVPEDLPDVWADEDMIVQVIVNLLSNALRFAKNKIQLAAEVEGESVRISVYDDGIGIAPEDMPKLFNKFEQFNRPQGGKGYKGTGLGLAICKHIIELHQGRIWAESTPNQGCRFSFTLPLQAPREIT